MLDNTEGLFRKHINQSDCLAAENMALQAQIMFSGRSPSLIRQEYKQLDTCILQSCTIKVKGVKELLLKGRHVHKELGRRLNDRDIPAIMRYLFAVDDVVSLDLSYNKITDVGFTFLCTYMSPHDHLVVLNMRNNKLENLSEESCRKLAKTKKLKWLTLSGNSLTNETVFFLRMFLMENKSLEILELGGVNYHAFSGGHIIAAIVKGNITSLKVLNLSKMISQKYLLKPWCFLSHCLYELLAVNETLVELHLEMNDFNDSDLEYILGGLKKNSSLKILNLTANHISSVGLENLAIVLPVTKLEVLLLRSNIIGNHGAIALSKTLPQSNIIHIDLSNNNIGDVGIANLLWTIKKDVPLYTFFIHGNPITSITFEIIEAQLARGKIFSDSLDIVVYMDDENKFRAAYNPEAGGYRRQMLGQQCSNLIQRRKSALRYPAYDVFQSSLIFNDSLKNYSKSWPDIVYPSYKDDFSVKLC